MNIENLVFLQDNLKYLGFGEGTALNRELEEQVKLGLEDFQLFTEAFFDDDTRTEAKLYFRVSDDSERYFFTRYEATLFYTNEPGRSRTQTIYIYKGKGFTFKETFNLLQGRAVNKDLTGFDGVKYNAWCQLDPYEKDKRDNYVIRQYREHYGYDLEKVLAKYPILELMNEELKAAILRSLQRGNIHPVHLLKGSKKEKVFIEANPQSRLINISSQATRAAFADKNRDLADKNKDFAKDRDNGPAGELPDSDSVHNDSVHNDSAEGGTTSDQEFLPAETEIPGVPAEKEELSEEQAQPATARTSHRKRVYK